MHPDSNFILPKRRFGNVTKSMWVRAFVSTFITFSPNRVLLSMKNAYKSYHPHIFCDVPKSSFGSNKLYAPESRTKILAMWETTFPRNSHAGLGRRFYEPNILTSMKHFRKVPTQSGVAISRKCCFPHGYKYHLEQPSATSPLFFDNLHFEHVYKSVNLDSWSPNEEV
jgi:hypothetical protein